MENKVVCGDNLEIMKGIPEDTFDCCITDPPGWLVDENNKPLHYSYYYHWLQPRLKEIQRIVRPEGFIAVFQNQMFFSRIWELFPPSAKVFICAKKEYDYLCQWQVKDSKSAFRMQYDPIMIWYNGGGRANYETEDFYICDNSGPNQRRNTRPLDVVKFLLERFSEGSVVDPFCGRGTTLVAAELLSRPYFGIDIEATACAETKKRLDAKQ